MTAQVVMRRSFLLVDGNGRNLDVVAKLERLSGNPLAHFSITSQSGSNHEEMLQAAAKLPAQVRSDIENLVAVHSFDTSNTPLHAEANAAFHCSEGNFKAALASLAGAGTIEQLYILAGKARTRHETEFKDHLATERKRFQNACVGYISARNVADGKGHGTWIEQSRAKKSMASLAKVLKDEFRIDVEKDVQSLRSVAEKGPDAKFDANLKTKHERGCLNEEMKAHVDSVCRPLWNEASAKAREALGRPDFRDERRPPINEDRTTFEGFAASEGLELVAKPVTERPDGFMDRAMRHFACMLKGPNGQMEFYYSLGSAHRGPPTVEMILESFQSDAASVHERTSEEFIDELYQPQTAKDFKKAQKAYDATVAQVESLKEVLGEDGYVFLVSKVGDNPPMEYHFDNGPKF